MTILDPFEDYPSNVVARFQAFHQQNPHIYKEFTAHAYDMRNTGRERYSGRTIIEKMRWDYDIKTKGSVFKVNDDFVPIYVRMLIHEHPEFDGFFERRKVRSRGIISDEQYRREYEEEKAYTEW